MPNQKKQNEAAAVAAIAVRNLSRIEDDETDLGEIIVRNPINVFNGVAIETFGPKPQVSRQANINTFSRKTQ